MAQSVPLTSVALKEFYIMIGTEGVSWIGSTFLQCRYCFFFSGIIHHQPTRNRMAQVLPILAWPWQPRSSWVEPKHSDKKTQIPSSDIIIICIITSPSLCLSSYQTRSQYMFFFFLFFLFYLTLFSLIILDIKSSTELTVQQSML